MTIGDPSTDNPAIIVDVYDLLIVTFLLFLPVLNLLLPIKLFCVSSPNNWNSLPLHIRSSDSLATFESRLKSHQYLRCDALYKHLIDIDSLPRFQY